MRYEFIDEQKKAYTLNLLCRVMQVSRNGYYRYLKRKSVVKPRVQKEERLIIEVKAIAQASRCSYGSRRIAQARLKAMQ